jgi:hypothetical protein
MLRLSLTLALVATIASVPPTTPGSMETLDGIAIEPALALGGWVAFKATGDNDAMAMGDIVLRRRSRSGHAEYAHPGAWRSHGPRRFARMA